MPHLLNENCVDIEKSNVEVKSENDPLNMNPLSCSSSSSPRSPPISTTAAATVDPNPPALNTQSELESASSSSSSAAASSSSSSPQKIDSPPSPHQETLTNRSLASPSSPGHTHSSSNGQDDCDEVKVYNEEGAEEDEQRTSDNLTEEKSEIIEAKPSNSLSSSHPFSVSNLMLFNSNQNAADCVASPTSASNGASSALNPFLLGYRSPLYNPLYSPELASHFASWWPAAAAASALYNPATNPFSAFAYQQQQFAAAAALSRFNPGLFLNSAAACAAAAAAVSSKTNNSTEQSTTNPHQMGSSSSSSSSSASPFSASSTTSTSSSSHKLNQHQSQYQANNNTSTSNSNSNSNNNNNQSTNINGLNKQSNHSSKIKQENSSRQHNSHQAHHPGHHPGHHHHHPHHQLSANANMYANSIGNLQAAGLSQHFGQHGVGGGGAGGQLAAPPPPHIQLPSKSKKPHIKKPLNAFMLFMKEQRAKVVNECTLRESAAINQILGRKWHELDRGEQAKYYEMARQERLKHMQLYPGWSARDNYGLKKKRRRKREKVIGENGELPRKCRARYGLQQINLWCKPCRRKKKCIRFANNENADTTGGSNGMGAAGPPAMIMGPNGQMYPNPMYLNGMMNGGESAGAGSLNGANSEDDYEDEYDDMGDELLPGGQEDETDEDDEDEDETDSEDDENEMDTGKSGNGLSMAQFGNASNPFNSAVYHPNKKANLDLVSSHGPPLSQIQQQFHQQFQQSMDSKNDLMQQIQQMHHQFNQSMHQNPINYSMFNAAANELAHTAAQN